MTIKVLLVDDDAMLRKLMTQVLRSWGFDFRLAVDGETALAVAEEFEPDVILLDVRMPGMGGPEFAEKYEGSAKIIVLSGYGEDVEVPSAFAKVMKPFNQDVLRDLIHRAAGQ